MRLYVDKAMSDLHGVYLRLHIRVAVIAKSIDSSFV